MIKVRKKYSVNDDIKDFLNKVFEAMDLKVEIVMTAEENSNVINVDLKGDDMGVFDRKKRTDSRFSSVSCKPCGKQTSERICESETGYGKLSCEKRRDAEASRKEYRTQGKKKQKAGFFRTDESV